MLIRITAKRQATFPARVLDALGVKPGDRLELHEGPDGYLLRARRVERALLAPLRLKLKPGTPPFNLHSFRETPHDSALRD